MCVCVPFMYTSQLIFIYIGWGFRIDLKVLSDATSSGTYTYLKKGGDEMNFTIQVPFTNLNVPLFQRPLPIIYSDPIQSDLPSCADLLRMIKDNDTFDVDISCATCKLDPDDSKPLRAHRCILSFRSPVFKAMLEGPMVEGTTGIILIDDVERDVMQEVLQFMYTNAFTGDMDTVLDAMGEAMLYAAHKYEIGGIVGLCEWYLARRLNNTNAYTMHQIASKYNLTKLTTAVEAYLARHSATIMSNLLASGDGDSCNQELKQSKTSEL